MKRSPRSAPFRLLLSSLLCAALGGAFMLAPVPAQADDKPAAAQRKRRAKPKKRKAKKKRARANAARRKPRGERTPATPRGQEPPSTEGRDSAADSEVVKEGDTEVKVMSFSGIDVEGRLRSPQLLYFVNRVRAEFDRPGLPHRSFIPEVARSTHGDELK